MQFVEEEEEDFFGLQLSRLFEVVQRDYVKKIIIRFIMYFLLIELVMLMFRLVLVFIVQVCLYILVKRKWDNF